MRYKIRPAILLGESILGFLCWAAMQAGYEQVAIAAVAIMGVLMPKLVESEEKKPGGETNEP